MWTKLGGSLEVTHSGILGDERDGETAGGLKEGREAATQAARPLFSTSIPAQASLGRRAADPVLHHVVLRSRNLEKTFHKMLSCISHLLWLTRS